MFKGFSLALALALSAAAPAAVMAEGKYVHANNSNYDTLDPHMHFDVARVAARLNFYDGLYRWVDNPPTLIPWIATSHEISPDGLKWTFKLRDDVRFQDGTLMTADDVVWSIDRMLTVKRGAGAMFLPLLDVGSTKAIDPTTVEFTLKEPSAIFASMVPDLLIVNSALVKSKEVDGDMGQKFLTDNVAGTGSFVLKRYDPARGFIAARFDDHFAGWGDNPLDEIEFRTVVETNTRIQGLLRGDFHGLDGYLAPDQVDRLRGSDKVQILEQESMRVFHFAMHNGRAPFDNHDFRMAMVHAFDYDGYINSIMKGTVARNPTILPNNIWGAPNDVTPYVYDIEKAKEYLAKVPADQLRTLRIGTLAGFAETEQAAAVMQNGLAQLGLKVEIESAPWPVVQSNMQNPQTMYDMVPYWKSTYYADPNNWIENYHTRAAPNRNVSDYHNPEVNALLDKALVITDQGERQALYDKAARLLHEDAAGIFIYNTKWFGPYSTSLEGIRFSPVGNAQDMRWTSFKK